MSLKDQVSDSCKLEVPADAESPVDSYDRYLSEYKSSADECEKHFAQMVSADSLFRDQQKELMTLLADTDSLWDAFVKARPGGSTQRRHRSFIEEKIEAMRQNLNLQGATLSGLSRDMERLLKQLAMYKITIQKSEKEHASVNNVIESRLTHLSSLLDSPEVASVAPPNRKQGQHERTDRDVERELNRILDSKNQRRSDRRPSPSQNRTNNRSKQRSLSSSDKSKRDKANNQ